MSCKVEICIRGDALRVSLYVIDEEILDRLMNATIDDALYEDNPLSLVGDISKDYLRIAQGFCVYKIDSSNVSLRIDGKKMEIEAVGPLYEDHDFEDMFNSDRNKTLFARTENSEMLGEGFSIESGQMFVVELEDIKYGELTCSVDYPSQVAFIDIELGVVDLDSCTEVSDATYFARLVNGAELDIRYLIINGKKYEMDMAIHNGYSSEFYLVRKINEVWKSEYLSIDIDEDDD